MPRNGRGHDYSGMDALGGANPGRSPFAPAIIDLSGDAGQSKPPVKADNDGVIRIPHADGTLTIDLQPETAEDREEKRRQEQLARLGRKQSRKSAEQQAVDFNENLAFKISDDELSRIAAEIMEGIDQDEQSRREWLEARSKGLRMLALKIEEPRGDMGTSSAPLEGMATVRHPLLLEATVAFQAGCRAELLPAAGPVKVRSDRPAAPSPPMPAPQPGAPPQPPPPGVPQGGTAITDDLANALEIDMNHYLTHTAKEYIPDTDRMFFNIAWSGDGFKKLYHCPLRRRPVSESVDAEDLIVSNSATDLQSCGRITHRIRMKRSTLRRMQILGAYRDVDIPREAAPLMVDAVEKEKADIGNYSTTPLRPKDALYTIYESYIELDLDEFAPKQFRGEGLPLPYIVTIEKDSRKILEIRRNWEQGDFECMKKRTFVQFPFIRGVGFYGLGFIHLLGQTVVALTAAWREMLDAGMFANFPGFLYARQVGRQLTNQFRVPPGGGIGLDIPSGVAIRDVVTPMPYKEMGPAFPAFVQHVEEMAKQIAMVSNSNVGEGRQDAPVGTTLALIEQATKVVASAFKRLHDAQSEEFSILVDLFREDPESMWRQNKRPAMAWEKQQFLAALDRYELVPVADPNNPTALHRAAKGQLLKTLQGASPMLYNPIAIDRRILSLANIDPEGLFAPPPPPPPPPPPDPALMLAQAKIKIEQQKAQVQNQLAQLKAQGEMQKNNLAQQGQKIDVAKAAMQQQGAAADRASTERLAMMEQELKKQQLENDMFEARLRMIDTEMSHMRELTAGAGQGGVDKSYGHEEKKEQKP